MVQPQNEKYDPAKCDTPWMPIKMLPAGPQNGGKVRSFVTYREGIQVGNGGQNKDGKTDAKNLGDSDRQGPCFAGLRAFPSCLCKRM